MRLLDDFYPLALREAREAAATNGGDMPRVNELTRSRARASRRAVRGMRRRMTREPPA